MTKSSARPVINSSLLEIQFVTRPMLRTEELDIKEYALLSVSTDGKHELRTNIKEPTKLVGLTQLALDKVRNTLG